MQVRSLKKILTNLLKRGTYRYGNERNETKMLEV